MTEAVLRPSGAEERVAAPRRFKLSIDYLPVGLFGSVMGLTGLSVAWRLAHGVFGTPLWIATATGAIGVIAFVALAVGYGLKAVTAPEAVAQEFRHPIAGNLFGTILISLLLLPITIAPYALHLAQALWVVGAICMFAFAWLMVTRWMSDRQQVAHATPAWIVPVVGLLDVPLALPSLDLPPMQGLMVASLAIGLFFAIPLFTLIFSRLVFEAPMPDALQPSLLILVAPFAVGMSAYVVTTRTFDLFAQALFMLTLFVLAVLLKRLRYLVLCCPFRVSWWAVSFPLAASAVASLRYATAQPSWTAQMISVLLLAVASVTIGALLVRTLVGIVRGELRTLSV
jgi:tellurite resistance protein